MGFFLWLELREMYLPLTLTHPWGTGGDAEKSCDLLLTQKTIISSAF